MDLYWLIFAFALGFVALQVGLPPLVGYLAAGFILNFFDFASGSPVLDKISDIGILLLLFSIGLKLSPRSLLKPIIWGGASLHLVLALALFWSALYLVNSIFPLFDQITPATALTAAFALSFSSTVFAVKILDESGEMSSVHGRIAIGVLIMQDIFAVVYLTISTGKQPNMWAPLLLLALWPARIIILKFLSRTGHGELLLVYGLLLAIGGAELFSLTGLKPDLGALLFGVLLSGHAKTNELSRHLMGLKDVFLIGFFLSIGLDNHPQLWHLGIAVILIAFGIVKGGLFFAIFTRFKLRARTSVVTSLILTNYSEFGLIVCATAVSQGLLPEAFLVIVALVVALSFAIAAPLNLYAESIYTRFSSKLKKLETTQRLREDQPIDTGDAQILVFGMGRIGCSAYDILATNKNSKIMGIDSNVNKVNKLQKLGINAVLGDATDADFFQNLKSDKIRLILLALPSQSETLDTIQRLKQIEFSGKIAATVRFPDQNNQLTAAGAHAVYNIYEEAGFGFGRHVIESFLDSPVATKKI